MIKEIEQLIRTFDYPDRTAPDVHDTWPAELAMKIVKVIAAEIDRIVVEATR